VNRDNRPIVNIFSKTALVGSLMVVLVNQAAAGLPVAVGGMALPSLAPMLETVQPAVVNISTTSYLSPGSSRLFQDPFFRQFFDLLTGGNSMQRWSVSMQRQILQLSKYQQRS